MDKFPGHLVIAGSIMIAGGVIGASGLAPFAAVLGLVLVIVGVALGFGAIRNL